MKQKQGRNYGLLIALTILAVFYLLVVAAGAAFGEERYNCSSSAGFNYAGFRANRNYNGSGVRGAGVVPCSAGTVSQTMRDFKKLRHEVSIETYVPQMTNDVVGGIFSLVDRNAEREFLLRARRQEQEAHLRSQALAAGDWQPSQPPAPTCRVEQKTREFSQTFCP
ncbi:MAG: hypothetical protein HYU35_02445 [Parcubacteria group bacterium]|nr:hypothetical protein [Parcubacteria group bacterium]